MCAARQRGVKAREEEGGKLSQGQWGALTAVRSHGEASGRAQSDGAHGKGGPGSQSCLERWRRRARPPGLNHSTKPSDTQTPLCPDEPDFLASNFPGSRKWEEEEGKL